MATEAELILKLTDQTQAGFKAIQSSLSQLQAKSKETAGDVGGLHNKLKEFGSGLLSGFGIGAGFATASGAANLLTGGLRALESAVADSIANLVQLGSQMSDLSAKTGLSTDALQQMKFAGSLVGVSLESVTGAITQMQRRLVETPEAFNKLGLSARQLIAMKPEAAFEAIADKIKAIPEPARQTAAAMEAFGRSGAQVLPLLKAGYSDLADEASRLGVVMDEQTLAAADRVDDAFTKIKATGEAFGNTLAALVVGNEDVGRALDNLVVVMGGVLRFVHENDEAFKRLGGTFVDVFLPGVKGAIKTLEALATLMGNLPSVTKKTGGFGTFAPMDAPGIDFAKMMADGVREAGKLEAAHQKLSKSIKQGNKEVSLSYNEMAAIIRDVEDEQNKQINEAVAFNLRQTEILDEVKAGLLEEFHVRQELHEEEAAIARDVAETQADMRAEMVDGLRDLADSLLDLGDAFGGVLGDVVSFGAGAVQVFANLNDDVLRAKSNMEKTAIAIQGAEAAFKSGSLLGGATAGASAGAAFGPIGAGIGAIAGGLLGLFGGAKKAREELAKLKDQVVGSFGSMQEFAKQAARAGVDVSKAFTTKDPKEFAKIVKQANDALEDQKKRLEGLKTAMSGLELMTKGWAAQVERAGGATAATQASFTRLGSFAVATFAGLVRETGDVIGALQQMGPSLDALQRAMGEFGFQASGAFARLLQLRDIVVANEDVANSISGLNQLMKGLGEAGMITKGLLLDMGAQARANFDELIARGVDAEAAMSLMQPTLQELWEQHKKLGVEYDANTQALIDQAEQQGLVGEQFMSVNEQMLEVLKILVETLGGQLPDALRRMGDAAQEQFGRMGDAASAAGGAAQGAFPGGGGGSFEDSAPGMATGGMVRAHPPFGTIIRAGEDEDEFVLNRRQLRAVQGGRGGGGGDVFLDGHKVGKLIQRREEIGTISPKTRLRGVR